MIPVQRSECITAAHILRDQVYRVHNGKLWVKVRPTTDMISHKFGEFVKTRTSRRVVKPKGKKTSSGR
jgi:ribosomal protein S19